MFGFNKQLSSFLTGSRRYGSSYATVRSDWDMVCFFKKDELELFKETVYIDSKDWPDLPPELGSKGRYNGFEANWEPFRIGNLNIIPVRTRNSWGLWKEATEVCDAIQPKTKDQSLREFDLVFGSTERPA